jgi:hypothetical protein
MDINKLVFELFQLKNPGPYLVNDHLKSLYAFMTECFEKVDVYSRDIECLDGLGVAHQMYEVYFEFNYIEFAIGKSLKYAENYVDEKYRISVRRHDKHEPDFEFFFLVRDVANGTNRPPTDSDLCFVGGGVLSAVAFDFTTLQIFMVKRSAFTKSKQYEKNLRNIS